MEERENQPVADAPLLPDTEQEDGDFLNRDAEDFRQKYPEVDLLELEQKSAFRRFCGSRLYKESAAALYADYLDFTEEARRSAQARQEDRAGRSTASGGGSAGGGLSGSERRALEEWNAAYPGMRMTAKEFKER